MTSTLSSKAITLYQPFPRNYIDKMLYLLMYNLHTIRGKAPDRIAVCKATLEDMFVSRVCKADIRATKWCSDGQFKIIKRTLRVPLIDFISSSSNEIVFEGKGDESLWDGICNGDAIVRLEIVPHDSFSISENNMADLMTKCKISLYNFYTGGKTIIKQLDGREIEVKFDLSNSSDMRAVVPNEGLPFNVYIEKNNGTYDTIKKRSLGDLVIQFEVVLPQFPENVIRNLAFRCALGGAFSSWTTKGLGQTS